MHSPVHIARMIGHHVMHQAAVIEHDDIADAPAMAVDQGRLHRMLVKEGQQVGALFRLQLAGGSG